MEQIPRTRMPSPYIMSCVSAKHIQSSDGLYPWQKGMANGDLFGEGLFTHPFYVVTSSLPTTSVRPQRSSNPFVSIRHCLPNCLLTALQPLLQPPL